MKNSDMQNKQVYEKALNDAWAKYAEVFELKSHEPNEAFKHVFAHAYRLGMETAKKQLRAIDRSGEFIYALCAESGI